MLEYLAQAILPTPPRRARYWPRNCRSSTSTRPTSPSIKMPTACRIPTRRRSWTTKLS